MKLIYPAIFTKDENAYYSEFPDLPGCQSFGDTIEETYEYSKEALAGYCLTLLADGKPLPVPTSIENICTESNSFVSFVETSTIPKEKAVKKTLTIPSWLNEVATERNVNFSQILKDALIEQLELQ